MDIKQRSDIITTQKNKERKSKKENLTDQFLLPEDEVPLEEIKRDEEIEKQGRGDSEPEEFPIKE